MQAYVAFTAHQPFIAQSGAFALYRLSKRDLAGILADWPRSYAWRIHSSGHWTRGDSGYHPTTRARHSVSAPIRAYLRTAERQAPLYLLYHGVGRDEIGAQALEVRGPVQRFDPFHPAELVRMLPSGPFDEIHSHYTLNVVSAEMGRSILQEIHDLLADDGFAVISVRRDL